MRNAPSPRSPQLAKFAGTRFSRAGAQHEGGSMQKALIIQSNGSGKEHLEDMLREGWVVVSITPNNGPSYNDFLVVLKKD